MSRTKRYIGGVGFGYASQFLVTLVGLWLTPFLLARTGQHDYGLWLVGAQVLAYLTLLDFGIVALLPREAGFVVGRARGDAAAAAVSPDLPQLVGQTLRLVLWQTPLVALAAALAWALMPAEWAPLRGPLGVVLAAFVVAFPLRVFQGVLQGLQDLAFLGKAQIVSWLLATALTVGLVLAGLGLYALAAGWVAGQLISTAVAFLRLRARFPGALPRGLPRLPRAAVRGRLVAGFWVSVNQVAVVLLAGTDLLVVGKLLGPAWVVPYACTAKLALVLANQPQMLLQAAIPALSELRAAADRAALARVSTALGQLMLLLSGAVICVVLVANRGFVEWWVGAELYGGQMLTALVLAAMLLRHLNLTIGAVLFSFGLERRLAVTGLLDGAVTVGAALLLTPHVGLLGAPLGSLLGVLLVSLPGNASALARGVGAAPLIRALAPWAWRFAPLAAASALAGRQLPPHGFAALAVAALVTSSVYAAVMLPVAWRDPVGEYVRPRVARLLSRAARLFQRPKPAMGDE